MPESNESKVKVRKKTSTQTVSQSPHISKKTLSNIPDNPQMDRKVIPGIQLNIPPLDTHELESISQETTARVKNTVDKVLEPTNIPAQNVLSPEIFQEMIKTVLNSDVSPQEKVVLCKQLVEMKDESDKKHADMVNENIRVRTEAAERIQAAQGPTWDEIGYALKVAGKIGLKALELWLNIKFIWLR